RNLTILLRAAPALGRPLVTRPDRPRGHRTSEEFNPGKRFRCCLLAAGAASDDSTSQLRIADTLTGDEPPKRTPGRLTAPPAGSSFSSNSRPKNRRSTGLALAQILPAPP